MNNFFRIFLFTLTLCFQFGLCSNKFRKFMAVMLMKHKLLPKGKVIFFRKNFEQLNLMWKECKIFLSNAPMEFSDETRSKLL